VITDSVQGLINSTVAVQRGDCGRCSAHRCEKLTANMSRQQWRDWVSPDIGYIELCPGLPIPTDA
jgi:hypothetical protein